MPAVVGDYVGMRDGDGLLSFNFRADRVREILTAMLDPAFAGFARTLLGRVERVQDDLPVAHDEQRVLQHPDVFERVAVDRNQVGLEPRFEAARLRREAEQLGAADCRRLDRRQRLAGGLCLG